jgi:signal transduction histidine kinase
LTVVVAAGTAELDGALRFQAGLLVLTAFGTMAFVAGVAWFVVSRGLRPLDAVAARIAAIDAAALKVRIEDAEIPKEIEPVVRQLNALLARLDAALERERGLTADIAHDLRTPVAEIRAVAEVTLSRTRESEEYREALGDIAATIASLQALIEKLLTLARLEAGQVKPDVTAIALRPALLEHSDRVYRAAATRAVTFEESCEADVVVAADPALLDTVLANVMSNAVNYTPRGGRIVVKASRGGDTCRLTVSNPGWALDAEEAGHVFERFWRADKTRTTSGMNCGLGLTLVKRAMEAMNGTAEAQVDREGWFVLELRFQRAIGGN